MDDNLSHTNIEQWSFRRFGADQEAQSASAVWDHMHRQAPRIFDGINDRKGELREAEETVWSVAEDIVALPNQTSVRDTGKTIKNITESILKHPVVQEVSRAESPEEDALVVIEISKAEWQEFIGLVTRLNKGGVMMATRIVNSLKVIERSKNNLIELDREIREFIATVWRHNQQRAKAFPPFFDLGPLNANVYGFGCVTTKVTNASSSSSSKPVP